MANIQSAFDGLSDEEFLHVRNAVIRATEGMTEPKNVDMRRVGDAGRVTVRITDLQVDSIERMLALLAIFGSNAVVETDEREEIRKRAA